MKDPTTTTVKKNNKFIWGILFVIAILFLYVMVKDEKEKEIEVDYLGQVETLKIETSITEKKLKQLITKKFHMNAMNAMAYEVRYWHDKEETYKRLNERPMNKAIKSKKYQLIEHPEIKRIQQAYSTKIHALNMKNTKLADQIKQVQQEMEQLKIYKPRDSYKQKQEAEAENLKDTCFFKNLNTQAGGNLKKRTKPTLIYDTTLVNHEIDFLFLRVELLNDVVDYFVVVESTYTFQQQPKKLFFKEKFNTEKRWDKYRHKIIHTVLDEKAPGTFKFWEGEVFIRNAIGTHGLNKEARNRNALPEPHDLIIINDLDELIAPELLKVMKYYEGTSQSIFSVNYRWTYYNFYWENMNRLEKCAISTFDHLVENNYEANKLRFNCFGKQHTPGVLKIAIQTNHEDGICHTGWHCSWCFPLSLFEHKVKSFALEYNSDNMYTKMKDKIPQLVQEGIWYRDNKRNARYTPTTNDLPSIRHPEKYPYLFPAAKPHTSCFSIRDFPKCLEGTDYVPPNQPPSPSRAYHRQH
mmetsp:Transcript_2222/g.3222  ORF Transcript_2222/g.3222 Transcript_2222/m.3222 type:complete len:523 (+) Transcript_2222:28-1596(+)